MKYPLLTETALLAHGLTSISNEKLREQFPENVSWLVWLDKGEIVRGNLKSFISFKDKERELSRIDGSMLDQACQNKLSGALTASGTMVVAAKYGIPLVITAGMGGIDNIKGSRISNDLTALANLPVSLIATAPKDMLNLPATVNWLRDHGVKVLGNGRDTCDGFIFTREAVRLCGMYSGKVPVQGGVLVLNSIPQEQRLTDQRILDQAIVKGAEARQSGYSFHPAVNKTLDVLTGGRSGELQLQSLIDNNYLALAGQLSS